MFEYINLNVASRFRHQKHTNMCIRPIHNEVRLRPNSVNGPIGLKLCWKNTSERPRMNGTETFVMEWPNANEVMVRFLL